MKVPFEAAVVRYMHDSATGEFVNVGVLLVAQSTGYADAKFLKSWTRVTNMFPDARIEHLQRLCARIEKAVESLSARSRIDPSGSRLPGLAQLFESLAREDGTGLAVSPVSSGATLEPAQMLEEFFGRTVSRFVIPAIARTVVEIGRARNMPAKDLLFTRGSVLAPDPNTFKKPVDANAYTPRAAQALAVGAE